jgi:hypothetical protein
MDVSPTPCACRTPAQCLLDTASADDPNEISFSKGETLDIVDKQGKWWQARKSDGTVGSMSFTSSRILQRLTSSQLRHQIISRSSSFLMLAALGFYISMPNTLL